MKLIKLNIFILISVILTLSCMQQKVKNNADLTLNSVRLALAREMEQSMFDYILDAWFPRCIDTVLGGFHTNFEYDWSSGSTDLKKVLVHQARLTWAASLIAETYPHKERFLSYAEQGYEAIRDKLWDEEYGGFYSNWQPDDQTNKDDFINKRIYGQSFAIYALSQYFKVKRDSSALDLARKAFYWMENNAYDREHGGYFEHFLRNGDRIMSSDVAGSSWSTFGLKEFNSTIHILEAYTELYRIWPDNLVRNRLEEIFFIVRDTMIHPGGYLKLYFYPDWTLVPDSTMERLSEGNYWYTQHVTYGHDVETAYLILEAAGALGMTEDEKTHRIAKSLVDHSLKHGWDHDAGGFYYAGKKNGEILVDHKACWAEAEGMNALLIMQQLYPEDRHDYAAQFLKLWNYTDEYLIDKEHGGWYNYGLDTYPGNELSRKSHAWKANYHNTRAMLNCLEMLKE